MFYFHLQQLLKPDGLMVNVPLYLSVYCNCSFLKKKRMTVLAQGQDLKLFQLTHRNVTHMTQLSLSLPLRCK